MLVALLTFFILLGYKFRELSRWINSLFGFVCTHQSCFWIYKAGTLTVQNAEITRQHRDQQGLDVIQELWFRYDEPREMIPETFLGLTPMVYIQSMAEIVCLPDVNRHGAIAKDIHPYSLF